MNSFSQLPLATELQKALVTLKFSTPTEIQAEVIPVSLKGQDLIACAETGSGKTGAYGIPLVQKLLSDKSKQALILAPTRELVHQIGDFIRLLISASPGLSVASLVGGADMRKQIHALKRRPQIIVATPGRLIDHLKRRTLQLTQTQTLVLDEGDRMLDMGFSPQLDEILKYLPKERQTSLFTATLPERVKKLAEKYLVKPIKIQVGEGSLPVAAIQQSIVQLTHKEKDNRIIDELNQRQGSIIVFTRTKQRTDQLARHLQDYGFSVDLIHGGRSQGQRNRAIDNFKKGKSRILCATDVAARGIDIPKVEHVINFDLPMMDEDYVHRIGRTGRNGASGQAVSFVGPDEHRIWKTLIRKYKITGADLVGVSSSSSRDFGDRRRSGGGGGSRSFAKKKPFFSRGEEGRGPRRSNQEGGGRSSSSYPRASSESRSRRSYE